ncbi:MAG: iron ABC transporter permease, partial [Bacteroidota bacterium]
TYDSMLNVALLNNCLQSFGLAFGTAIAIVIAALLLVYFVKWTHLRGFNSFARIATIGYVIPGAIIGIGMISSSQFVINFFDRAFHLDIGHLVYGSSLLLVYAYIFRFLTVAYHPIEANSLKLGKNLAESAYLLGKNQLKTLWNIELPLLRTTLTSAFLLVFIETLKELPLTLILKPYNLNTLAVTAYAYAEDERVAKAAIPALLLVGSVILVLAFVHAKQEK